MSKKKQIQRWLGYTAAAATVAAAILTPFLLMNKFTHLVAATGVRPDPAALGMAVRAEYARAGYQVIVREPFHKRGPLDRTASFIEIDFTPAAALPPQVAETLDLDGDGKPDVTVRFAVPRDPDAPLMFDSQPLTGLTVGVAGGRKESYSRLIARVNERIVVRVPMK